MLQWTLGVQNVIVTLSLALTYSTQVVHASTSVAPCNTSLPLYWSWGAGEAPHFYQCIRNIGITRQSSITNVQFIHVTKIFIAWELNPLFHEFHWNSSKVSLCKFILSILNYSGKRETHSTKQCKRNLWTIHKDENNCYKYTELWNHKTNRVLTMQCS